MMWAAISHTGKTALVHIPGNLIAQCNCDEILQPHVLPLMQQNGARFQHDKVLISSSVYPSSSNASFQQEPRLVAEPNCSPALLWPYSMCPNPLKSDLTVSAGQNKSFNGMSCSYSGQ
jgi:hypothetical protein